MQFIKYTRLFVGILIFTLNILPANAQNITSPYSILGIGDVDSKDFGRFFGSGNASIARRSLFAYNFTNPASLTSLPFKTMHFDISTRGRSSNYFIPDGDSSLVIPSTDFIVKRITMAFKVTPKVSIAAGLKPYSSINYFYLQDNAILDGNTSYFKVVGGGGGINQFYFSYAREFSKRISIGATASWLFGGIQRETKYASQAISLNVTKNENDFYTGALFQGGMQYYSLPEKKWRHHIGLTTSVSTNLQGELTTEYNDMFGAIKKDIERDRKFKLPITVGIGYSAVKNEKLTFSLEANYYHWKYQKVNYSHSYTNPSFRFSGGFEYAIIKKDYRGIYEKGYVSAGASLENSYIRIKKNNLMDFSFSVGGGKNVSRNLSFYTGIEFGKRGDKNYNQVQEQYTQFVLGLTLKDIWLGPKFKRYD